MSRLDLSDLQHDFEILRSTLEQIACLAGIICDDKTDKYRKDTLAQTAWYLAEHWADYADEPIKQIGQMLATEPFAQKGDA